MLDFQINFRAVLIAAAANVVLGILWYGPIFGKQWKALMGFTDESMKSMKMTVLKAMVGGVIVALLMSFVLANAVSFANGYTGATGVNLGLMTGFWSWLGFVVPVTMSSVLWEGKPWKLWFLNASYWFFTLLAMGVTLAIVS